MEFPKTRQIGRKNNHKRPSLSKVSRGKYPTLYILLQNKKGVFKY